MFLGDLRVDCVSDGEIWLDGGAMFGVVPRVFWERHAPPDSKNRIRLGLNTLLVRSGSRTILIDTGCGSKFSEKDRKIYSLRQGEGLLGRLAALGIAPEAVDIVINTHLHFDHCGGNTRWIDGRLAVTFPNAQYIVQAQEFEEARHPNERNRASYLSENWDPILEEGRLRLIEGVTEVVSGVTCVPTPGHTLGHQSVQLRSGGETLMFLADLCPTRAHVPLPWIMGYDLYPMKTLETRRKVYPDAIENHWKLVFQHDPVEPLGRLEESEGRLRVRPLGSQ